MRINSCPAVFFLICVVFITLPLKSNGGIVNVLRSWLVKTRQRRFSKSSRREEPNNNINRGDEEVDEYGTSLSYRELVDTLREENQVLRDEVSHLKRLSVGQKLTIRKLQQENEAIKMKFEKGLEEMEDQFKSEKEALVTSFADRLKKERSDMEKVFEKAGEAEKESVKASYAKTLAEVRSELSNKVDKYQKEIKTLQGDLKQERKASEEKDVAIKSLQKEKKSSVQDINALKQSLKEATRKQSIQSDSESNKRNTNSRESTGREGYSSISTRDSDMSASASSVSSGKTRNAPSLPRKNTKNKN